MESISSTAMPVVRDDAHSPQVPEPLEFSDVYRRYFGFAWASLRRLGVPAASIDDAAQDFWVTVHRRLATLQADASTKAWLFGVARRIASHHRRRDFRNRRKLAAFGDAAASRADHSMRRRDVALSLEVALDRLDEPKRTAFVLSELEGWSAPEIAKAVGSKPNTIYSRIRLAKEQLREHLSDGGDGRSMQELTDETRDATQPPRGAAKRCLAAIAPNLSLAVPAAATPAATGLATAGLSQLKLALVGAGIGAAVLGGAHVVLPAADASEPIVAAPQEPMPEPQPAAAASMVARAPAPVAEPRAQEPTSDPAPAPEPNPSRPGASPKVEAPPETSADPLADETRLLSAAQQAIASGQPEQALAQVAEHAERFPRGKLRDLRTVLEVEALCSAGRTDEARRRARKALDDEPPRRVAEKLAASCTSNR